MSINFSRVAQRVKVKSAIIQALKHGIILEELIKADDDLLSYIIRSMHLELYGVDESYSLMNSKVLELAHDRQIEYIIEHYNRDLLKEFRRIV